MDGYLPIGEFSARCGLSPKRLRTYAAGGLLVPAAVDSVSGYRYYAPDQLPEAELIEVLRRAGVPLAEIAELLRCRAGDRLDAWARQLEDDAARRLRALELARDLLAGEPSHDRNRRAEGSIVKLNVASRSETGHVRADNEDAVMTGPFLAGVADGMGGGPGGRIASGLVAALVRSSFTGRSLDELAAAVRAANRAIWERAREDAGLEGMGTTVCALGLLRDGSLGVVNVGDSRAYLVSGGSLVQLTQDHSVTAELVRRGELAESDAAAHPHRHVLTRALGVGPEVELDSGTHTARPGDRILLGTDGLFNEVPPPELEAALGADGDLQATADRLVDLVLAGTAPDNVSVIVAEIAG